MHSDDCVCAATACFVVEWQLCGWFEGGGWTKKMIGFIVSYSSAEGKPSKNVLYILHTYVSY